MNVIKPIKEPAAVIEKIIKRFINESPENTLKNEKKDKAWAEPIIGFSSGADPLYEFYKRDIGDFYWTPLEIFSKTFPQLKVTSDQLTVISWVLPQTEATKADNRKQTAYPSQSWARARIYGEEVNTKLRKHVVSTLLSWDYKSVAPMISTHWKMCRSDRYGRSSNWSERHAAYASGLGTFGLCDGLITPKGKAMRCGSVIAQIKIPTSGRQYTDHQAYCLFFSKGICGKCIQRCPVKAITKKGHNKDECRGRLQITRDYVKTNFGFEGYGCGLCQTGVPCESKIPTESDLK